MTGFEFYDQTARAVIVAADREARILGASYLGCESLFLGCLAVEDSLASQALQSLGVTLEVAREYTKDRLLLWSNSAGSPSGVFPYTPPARIAIEGAVNEARIAGASIVGSEHLLLAVLAQNSMLITVLDKLGLTPGQVKARVTELIHDGASGLPIGVRLSKRGILRDFGEMLMTGRLLKIGELSEDQARLIAAAIKAFAG
ncbi:MAG TPA: Clp protease N-terminal domain-containing protein [Candidatus Saccharimonadia bacterium]|jgi:ATP-dependent Clp protease ATP-binding subunit ClpC